MLKYPVYKATINDDPQNGVYAISLVDQPAIKEDFIAMEKNMQVVLSADKTRLIGPVLIPDMPILRLHKQTQQYYYIVYDKEVIKQAKDKFVSQNLITQSNLQHDSTQKIEGSFIENWCIEFKEHDKSNGFGFDLPVGTWMAEFRAANPADLTDEFLQKYKGFSIEAFFDLEPIEQNLIIMENTKSKTFLDFLRGWFGAGYTLDTKLEDIAEPTPNETPAPEEVQVKQLVFVTSDGVSINWDEETMVCNYLNEDGSLGDVVPDGVYPLSDGSNLIVTEGLGSIESVEMVAQKALVIQKELIIQKQIQEIEILKNTIVELGKQPAAKVELATTSEPVNLKQETLTLSQAIQQGINKAKNKK